MTIQTPNRTNRRKPGLSVRVDPAPARPVPAPGPATLPGRRNPKWIALGLVSLCLGALLSYVIYSRVADQTAVIAVVHTVPRGATIQATDLTTVSMTRGASVTTVPGAQLGQLVGQQAVYDLVGGSLLPQGAVAAVVLPQHGRAVVGVRLVPGRIPSGDIPAGSVLRLIALPPAGAEPGFTDAYTGRTYVARDISQEPAADGTSTLLNVDVPAAQAPTVALLAAQDRLVVVRDAQR